tara:strand:- start:184 stop:507 length:324 start_codon:yes stop_codon:yes gene_type:complete
MYWTRKLIFDTQINDNKLFVTLTSNHVKGCQGFQEERYGTETVITYLNQNNIEFDEVLSETEVFNYQTEKSLTGTWVFSLPKKKKTTKPIEKKENVTKISNKKTTKR